MPRFVFVFFFLYFLLGISVKLSNFVEVRLVSTTVVVDRLIFFFLNYLLLIFFIWVLSTFASSAKPFFFFFFVFVRGRVWVQQVKRLACILLTTIQYFFVEALIFYFLLFQIQFKEAE